MEEKKKNKSKEDNQRKKMVMEEKKKKKTKEDNGRKEDGSGREGKQKTKEKKKEEGKKGEFFLRSKGKVGK